MRRGFEELAKAIGPEDDTRKAIKGLLMGVSQEITDALARGDDLHRLATELAMDAGALAGAVLKGAEPEPEPTRTPRRG